MLEEMAEVWSGDEVKDAETVAQYVSTYADLGCDELVFCPSAADAEQVDLLADAAGL